MVQLMPMPPHQGHHVLLHYTPVGLTFLVLAYPGFPGKETVKWDVAKMHTFLVLRTVIGHHTILTKVKFGI